MTAVQERVSVTLIDQQGHRLAAVLIHVFTREEVEGWGEDADPTLTFHLFALLLLRKRPEADRVALILAGSLPLFLAGIGERWVDADEKPVRVMRKGASS